MAGEDKVKERMQGIWVLACRLDCELNKLDDLVNSRSVQNAALQSCQAQYREWRGYDLGELMNLFGIPPEKRRAAIEKGSLKRK